MPANTRFVQNKFTDFTLKYRYSVLYVYKFIKVPNRTIYSNIIAFNLCHLFV